MELTYNIITELFLGSNNIINYSLFTSDVFIIFLGISLWIVGESIIICECKKENVSFTSFIMMNILFSALLALFILILILILNYFSVVFNILLYIGMLITFKYILYKVFIKTVENDG